MVPLELVLRHALLLGRDDVAGQHRQHGAVHRHRDADLVERDAVEQDLHVLDRVDRHAGLADVAGHARVVAVVAAVGRQVEGDADALPAGGQRLAIEARCESSAVEKPAYWRIVHGRTAYIVGLRPAHERLRSRAACRRAARQRGMSAAVYSGLTVRPSGVVQFSAARSPPGADFGRGLGPLLERDPREFVRVLAHVVLGSSEAASVDP